MVYRQILTQNGIILVSSNILKNLYILGQDMSFNVDIK